MVLIYMWWYLSTNSMSKRLQFQLVMWRGCWYLIKNHNWIKVQMEKIKLKLSFIICLVLILHINFKLWQIQWTIFGSILIVWLFALIFTTLKILRAISRLILKLKVYSKLKNLNGKQLLIIWIADFVTKFLKRLILIFKSNYAQARQLFSEKTFIKMIYSKSLCLFSLAVWLHLETLKFKQRWNSLKNLRRVRFNHKPQWFQTWWFLIMKTIRKVNLMERYNRIICLF